MAAYSSQDTHVHSLHPGTAPEEFERNSDVTPTVQLINFTLSILAVASLVGIDLKSLSKVTLTTPAVPKSTRQFPSAAPTPCVTISSNRDWMPVRCRRRAL